MKKLDTAKKSMAAFLATMLIFADMITRRWFNGCRLQIRAETGTAANYLAIRSMVVATAVIGLLMFARTVKAAPQLVSVTMPDLNSLDLRISTKALKHRVKKTKRVWLKNTRYNEVKLYDFRIKDVDKSGTYQLAAHLRVKRYTDTIWGKKDWKNSRYNVSGKVTLGITDGELKLTAGKIKVSKQGNFLEKTVDTVTSIAAFNWFDPTSWLGLIDISSLETTRHIRAPGKCIQKLIAGSRLKEQSKRIDDGDLIIRLSFSPQHASQTLYSILSGKDCGTVNRAEPPQIANSASGINLDIVGSPDNPSDARKQWDAGAPWCVEREDGWAIARGPSERDDVGFPSKNAERDTTKCNDGDSVLFNGLLCAAGEEAGCDAVLASQSQEDGQWWRSPRKVDGQVPDEDAATFSRDHVLGVLLTLAETHDEEAARAWWAWIAKNPYRNEGRPEFSISGGYRVCKDEQTSGTCLLTHELLALFQRVWTSQHYSPTLPIDKFVKDTHGQLVDDAMLGCYAALVSPSSNTTAGPCEEALRALGVDSSHVQKLRDESSKGPVQHVYAAEVLLRYKLNQASIATAALAKALAEANPKNAFFQFLNEGPTERVRSLHKHVCGTAGSSDTRREWMWERRDVEKEQSRSMLWDCVFVDNLLNGRRAED